MSKNSKQAWQVGQSVRCGFLTLTVIASLAPRGDGLPGAQILTNGSQLYSFTPYSGLEKISDERAVELCEESKRITEAAAARSHAQVARVAANAAVCAKLQAIAA